MNETMYRILSNLAPQTQPEDTARYLLIGAMVLAGAAFCGNLVRKELKPKPVVYRFSEKKAPDNTPS